MAVVLILLSACQGKPDNVETLPSDFDPFDTSKTTTTPATSTGTNSGNNSGTSGGSGGIAPSYAKPIPQGNMDRKNINNPYKAGTGYAVYNGLPLEYSFEGRARDADIYDQGYMVFI
jgi:hypothetical protein